MGTSTWCPYWSHLLTSNIQEGKTISPAHPELLNFFTIQTAKVKINAKNGDHKMRNEPTASATDTAMRNFWNEKKNTNVNWLTLEEQVHVFKQILRILWLPYSWCALKIFSLQKCFTYLILGSTHKVATPPWYRGGGGGAGVGWWSPSLEFLIWCSLKDFTFSGKPLIFSKKWGEFYGLWHCWRPVTSSNMVAVLDFTKN